MSNKIKILIVIYIALLSIIIRGYTFGLGDQVINLPLIFKTQNPQFYPQDYFFSAQPEKLSFFYSTTGKLISIFGNTETTIFIIYAVCITLFFLVYSKLAEKIQKNGFAWFLSLLFIIIPYHIGGSAIMTLETALSPRAVGHIFSLLVLYFIFSRKYTVSFLILGLELLFHPLSALYAGIILYSHLYFVEKEHKIKTLLKGTFILIIFSLFINSELLPQFLPSTFRFSENIWIEILKLRNPYAFPVLWKIRGWMSLILGITPLIVYLIMHLRKNKKLTFLNKSLLNILLVSFATMIFQLFFTSIIPLTPVIKLQLGRIWLFPVIFSFICLSIFVVQIIQYFKINEKIIISISLLILSFASLYKVSWFRKTQIPEWQEVQQWARNNTSQQCVFLVPFTSEGFRVYSQRPTTGEYKDGTLSFYSPDFAYLWKNRLDDLYNWEKNDDKTLRELQEKYNFSFIISETYFSDNLNLIFKNNVYRIYAMPNLLNDCTINDNII